MLLRKILVVYLIHFWGEHLVEAVITTQIACSLNLSQSSVSKQIEERIEDKGSLRLIRYHFNIKNDTGPFSSANTGKSFLINPYSSVLAIDVAAKSLLHLKEYFVQMSLYTLNFSIAEYQVELEQWPTNCLENVSATEIETELKLLIFRNFGASRSSVITLEGEVCNQYMKDIGQNIGVATYNCCRLDAEEKLICNDLEKTVWTDTLFAAIMVLQVVFVLYCPNLLPTSGRKGDKYVKYTYKPLNKPKLRVMKIKDGEPDRSFVRAYPFQRSALPSFKKKLRGRRDNTLYIVDVKELQLFVNDIKVVAYGGSPVTFFGFLKSFFLRCDKMKDFQSEMRTDGSKTFSWKRDDLLDLESCCNTNVCPNVCGEPKPCNCCTKHICLWYQMLAFLMKLVYVSLTIPWWVRVWFYYKVEEGSMTKLNHILDENGLNQSYQDSLVLSLTPLHPFFLSMYGVCFLSMCIFFFLKAETKVDINSTLRKTLDNTRDEKRFDAFLKFIAFMLIPVKRLGFLGIFLIPFWLLAMLPLGLVVLSIIIFPMINFTIRLLLLILSTCRFWEKIRFFIPTFGDMIKTNVTSWIGNSKSVDMRARNLLCYSIALILSWLVIFVSLIFIFESLGFYAECIMYLLIGVMLNHNDTYNFVVLILSIAIYAYRCFKSVASQYQAFGKHILEVSFKKIGDGVKKVAAGNKEDQLEQAFAVPARRENDRENDIKLSSTPNSHSYLKCQTKRLLLFLNTNDIVHISSSFLMKVAKLDHVFCPGHVHTLYLRAIVKLIWISLFLAFHFLLIAAFAHANNSSSFSQIMAAIAVGLLPYIFDTYVMRTDSPTSLKESDISWNFQLQEKIDNFKERWYLADIVSDNMEVGALNADADLIVKHTAEQPNDRQAEKWEFWVKKLL